MTVSVSTRLSPLYVGNNVNTIFSFTFRIFKQEGEDGISIRLKTADGFTTLDKSLYIVSVNSDNLGGHVEFKAPPSVIDLFYIAGTTPADQQLDITNYDNFYPDAIEVALDKLTVILQEWSTLLTQETQARQVKDDQLEQYVKDYVDSVLQINNPGVISSILADIVKTNVAGIAYNQQDFNEFLLDFVNTRYPDINEFMEEAQQTIDNLTNQLQQQISADIAEAVSHIEQGFIKTFPTTAALQAFVPPFSPYFAKAMDTRKIWRWDQTSAPGATPVTGTWTDSGLSDLDQANQISIRSAWQVAGQVLKQRTLANGTTEEITITDLSINKGAAGDGGIRVRGGTFTVPRNQALYIDLNDTPDAQARITAKLTTSTSDFGWISAGEGIGAFFKDKRIFLFINDSFGFGGALMDKSKYNNKRDVGDVWIAAAGNVDVAYDYSTKTLSWNNALFLPMFGLQRRYRLPASSIVLNNIGTAWVDLSLAASNGDIPLEAIKFGAYGTSDSANSYEGLPHQLPFYIYNANVPGKHFPVGGFPKPSEPSQSTSNLSDDDIVVIGSTDATTGLQVINVYMKGTKAGSRKYIHWLIKRVTLPKDTSQEASNMDAYRLDAIYEVDKVDNSNSFTPSRSGRALAVGEFSCAIRENGKPDYSGGAHGDEYQERYSFLIDGVPKSLGSGSNFVCKRFELIQVSHVLGHMQDNLPENTNFNRTLHLTFEKQRMNQKQQIRWVKSIIVRTAYQAMLPIRRLIQVTSGEQITTTAMRSPIYQAEDVSSEGFPVSFSFGYLPESKIWGETGISAQVIPKKYPSISSCNFWISNPNLYNKFYFSLAGEDSGAAGALRYTTTVGEVWDSEFDFIFDTTL